MENNLLPIAKEGWKYLLYALAFLSISLILDLEILAWIFLFVIVFLGYSFRNPERELLSFEERSVLSPVDATLIAIEELDDNEYFYKLTLNSSYTDVSVLRMPISSKIECKGTVHGARLCLNTSLGKKINEHTSLVFQDKYNNKIKVKHILKESFCGMKIDTLKQTDSPQSKRYGVMLNGITEVYLPENFRLNVSTGDEVQASQTLLGYFS